MNEEWIALVRAAKVAAETGHKEVTLSATQAIIKLLGPHDLASKGLMEAHNLLADGYENMAFIKYNAVIEMLRNA